MARKTTTTMKRTAEESKLLKTVSRHVDAMIAKRLPDFDSLVKVRNQLSELVVAAKSIAQRDPSVGDGLPSDFVSGLDAVILAARSFRSGYASNDASQQIEDLSAIPGFAPVNTVKSVAKSEGKRVPMREFVDYAAEIVKSIAGLDVPGQLDALRSLQAICRKANEEDFSDVLIPTSNDPGKQKADVTEGSITAAAGGTSAPSTASTNFAAEGVPAAGAASGASNASTGSVVAGAGVGTGGASETPFAGGGTPTASAAGAASGTSAVATAAGGAGETGSTGPNNFAATDVSKAATVGGLDAIEKAASAEEDEIDWSGDLTRARFMKGEKRDLSKSFGQDDDEARALARGTRRRGSF